MGNSLSSKSKEKEPSQPRQVDAASNDVSPRSANNKKRRKRSAKKQEARKIAPETSSESSITFDSHGSSSPSDETEALFRCHQCEMDFDTDISLLLTTPKHRLPFTCTVCFRCTCCYACLRTKETNPVVCPHCYQPGFNLTRPVPDRNVCMLLDALQNSREEASLPATKYSVGTTVNKVGAAEVNGQWV